MKEGNEEKGGQGRLLIISIIIFKRKICSIHGGSGDLLHGLNGNIGNFPNGGGELARGGHDKS